MNITGNEIVDQFAGFSIEGNIIPHLWYEHLKTDKGKTDLIAITLLGDFVYWYRPREVRSENGAFIRFEKRFKADLLQRSYKEIQIMFGITEKQAREALIRLESKGLAKRIFRDITTDDGKKLFNVMYIEINPEKIKEISLQKSKDPSLQICKHPINKFVNTNTEITNTEITKYIKTYAHSENASDSQEEVYKEKEKKNPKEYSEDFEKLWKQYPNKKDKRKAYLKYMNKLKEYSYETIEKGMNNYVKECEEENRYFKHLTTFLNGDCFMEYQEEQEKKPKRTGTAKSDVKVKSFASLEF